MKTRKIEIIIVSKKNLSRVDKKPEISQVIVHSKKDYDKACLDAENANYDEITRISI